MNPKSIATVGAGNNPLKMGAIQALSIVKDGYAGKFYPLHPTEKEVFGYKAYPSALDLPEAPDLVMFVLPAPLVIDILDDFGKIGTRRAIVITAGFRETGAEGMKLEEKLKEIARKHDIRFLGPNCMGILNSSLPLNVTVAPLTGPPGLLGMASQSGTYITQTLPYLQRRGIRFSKAISVGNEADIDITESLEFLGEDQQTRAIALYIEGLKDARRFLDVACRITPHKPVIAQYVGGTDAGARAGSSHTGALAGPDFLYDGLFRQAGIIRVDSVEDLYFQGWALASQPLPPGKRVGVLTNSGGPGTAMAHTCNRGGLEVPEFSQELQIEIKKHIPPHGSTGNPVDLTFHMDTEVISTKLPEIILKSGEVDGLVIHGLMGSGFLKAIYPHLTGLVGDIGEEEFANRFARDLDEPVSLPARYGLPVILSSFFGREDNYTRAYQDRNIPVFDGPEKAARGMLALHRYNEIRQRDIKPGIHCSGEFIISDKVTETIEENLKRGNLILDEYTSKQVLAAYGAQVCKEMPAFDLEAAIEAASHIGYPVVLKACSSQYAHKSGKGLIYLNLLNEVELAEAYRSIIKAAGFDVPVLISEMIKGERELMAGMVRHSGFGPCIMFGLGGIFAEALSDRVFRLAPLDNRSVFEMFEDLKAGEILNDYRGLPAVEKKVLASSIQAVAKASLLHPQIAEIDINPIIISGSRPVIADALLVLQNRDDCPAGSKEL